MKPNGDFEIFLATAPGLEAVLCDEVKAHGFRAPKAVAGGVTIEGRWHDVWRANLVVRGASRVLMRIASFRTTQLADLETRARRIDWGSVLRSDAPVRVEASCSRSRIYHSGAAAQRVATAIAERLGVAVSDQADVAVMVRFDSNVCTVSLDTSGELLHKRGFKEAVSKAPLRENLAALFLRQCGYAGREPVLDPLCGSGTFVIEAAEIAAGLSPGRARGFAFEQFATFDAEKWQELCDRPRPAVGEGLTFYGRDRDAGAIAMGRANAERAGVTGMTDFETRAVSSLAAPAGSPGLVIANPPYGVRIGDRTKLKPLYRALGQRMRAEFPGWRIGVITTDAELAKATGLDLTPAGTPVAHGGLRVTLFRAGPVV